MDKINAIVKKLIMNVMILGLGILVSCSKAPDFITVTSPDGKIKLVVDLKDSVSYSIVHEGEVLVSPSALAMKFEGGRMLGVGEASYKVKIGSASESVDAPFYRQNKISAEWNYARVDYADWTLEFRVYNEVWHGVSKLNLNLMQWFWMRRHSSCSRKIRWLGFLIQEEKI